MTIYVFDLLIAIVVFGAIGMLAYWAFSKWPGFAVWQTPITVILGLLLIIALISVLTGNLHLDLSFGIRSID